MGRTVQVESTGRGFEQRIVAGPHALAADEPASVGGGDAGPNPYDLLLAALGACTSMTLGMYARRKGWQLEKVIVRLSQERIHAEDCRACESKAGMVDRIEREVEVVGPLSEEQRQRLLEIAEKCPVHRTLVGESEIVTRLAPARP